MLNLPNIVLLKRQGYIEVPFVSTKTGLAVVEAEANGERLQFLVDTGAMVCVVGAAVITSLLWHRCLRINDRCFEIGAELAAD